MKFLHGSHSIALPSWPRMTCREPVTGLAGRDDRTIVQRPNRAAESGTDAVRCRVAAAASAKSRRTTANVRAPSVRYFDNKLKLPLTAITTRQTALFMPLSDRLRPGSTLQARRREIKCRVIPDRSTMPIRSSSSHFAAVGSDDRRPVSLVANRGVHGQNENCFMQSRILSRCDSGSFSIQRSLESSLYLNIKPLSRGVYFILVYITEGGNFMVRHSTGRGFCDGITLDMDKTASPRAGQRLNRGLQWWNRKLDTCRRTMWDDLRWRVVTA
jgi:hypothetical protein